jgi:hypothetical protein
VPKAVWKTNFRTAAGRSLQVISLMLNFTQSSGHGFIRAARKPYKQGLQPLRYLLDICLCPFLSIYETACSLWRSDSWRSFPKTVATIEESRAMIRSCCWRGPLTGGDSLYGKLYRSAARLAFAADTLFLQMILESILICSGGGAIVPVRPKAELVVFGKLNGMQKLLRDPQQQAPIWILEGNPPRSK